MSVSPSYNDEYCLPGIVKWVCATQSGNWQRPLAVNSGIIDCISKNYRKYNNKLNDEVVENYRFIRKRHIAHADKISFVQTKIFETNLFEIKIMVHGEFILKI